MAERRACTGSWGECLIGIGALTVVLPGVLTVDDAWMAVAIALMAAGVILLAREWLKGRRRRRAGRVRRRKRR